MLGRTRHLHQWAVGKPFAVAMLAQQATALATIVTPYVELIRQGLMSRTINEQGITRNWLALYREPDRFRETVSKMLTSDDSQTQALIMGKLLAAKNAMPKGEAASLLATAPEEAVPIIEQVTHWTLRLAYMAMSELVSATMDGEDDDVAVDVDMDGLMTKSEIQFFIIVMLPALLEFGESATRIFARARRGNLQSLDQLIRLDKTVMGHERIKEHVGRYGMEKLADDTEIVMKAYMGWPETCQSELAVKSRLSAYVIEWSRAFGCNLGPLDMRKVFDAFEKDKTGNANARDEDLPESSDAWRRDVWNAKPFFENILRRDIDSMSACYGQWVREALVSDFDESEAPPIWLQSMLFGGEGFSPG